MDPLSILSLGFGVAELYGNKQQAEGGADALEASAGLYDIQAQAVIANAEYAVRRAEESGRREVGTAVARFAKAGVRFEGTPAMSVAETERSIRLDILATRINAASKANELGFRGMNQRIMANFTRMNAEQDMSMGILKLGSNFLMKNVDTGAGASKMSSEIYKFNTTPNQTYGSSQPQSIWANDFNMQSRNIPNGLTVSRIR